MIPRNCFSGMRLKIDNATPGGDNAAKLCSTSAE
jgi:hypothetical protein